VEKRSAQELDEKIGATTKKGNIDHKGEKTAKKKILRRRRRAGQPFTRYRITTGSSREPLRKGWDLFGGYRQRKNLTTTI